MVGQGSAGEVRGSCVTCRAGAALHACVTVAFCYAPRRAFPRQSTQSRRTAQQEIAKYSNAKGGNKRATRPAWALKEGAADADTLLKSISPEQVCGHESMMAGQLRLDVAGIGAKCVRRWSECPCSELTHDSHGLLVGAGCKAPCQMPSQGLSMSTQSAASW